MNLASNLDMKLQAPTLASSRKAQANKKKVERPSLALEHEQNAV